MNLLNKVKGKIDKTLKEQLPIKPITFWKGHVEVVGCRIACRIPNKDLGYKQI